MLKHLPQLMKFKTAMDVRIGYPNEHLAGTSKTEINQPMYATSVGLIMKGFEYLETYKKSFSAGRQEEFVRPVRPEVYIEQEEPGIKNEVPEMEPQEGKMSITDKIKAMMRQMFEVEDQTIA
jgi:cell division protein FtsA